MIERAAKMADWLRGTYGFSPEMNAKCVQLLKDMAGEMERLRAERDAAQWISVEERLPEKEGKYIVCTAKGSVYCTKFSTRHGPCFHTDLYTHITHWMPLPEPPGEDA